MPVLRCEGCGYTFAWTGKTLSVPECPDRCRGGLSPALHVDRHLVDVAALNGDGLDGHHTGAARRERNAAAAARYGV